MKAISNSKKMFLPLTLAIMLTIACMLIMGNQVTAKSDKATICHLPAGDIEKANTLHVGQSAVPAHLAHGDYLGECMDHQEEPPNEGGGGGSLPL